MTDFEEQNPYEKPDLREAWEEGFRDDEEGHYKEPARIIAYLKGFDAAISRSPSPSDLDGDSLYEESELDELFCAGWEEAPDSQGKRIRLV